ncbi:hypothetical protein Ccar_16710 [Clostridium carboxidivorans P7]|uniref:hypothetical protein n=1 Tax=Clostridium carboxidivorans TaxID=217159 RepID=UPI00064EEC6B|nr:hypothetical protein [Clostridium carboxidivorans]AKN32411.1 hypothetical protein Ccar_16710 [Clostridium carboxidivorans P7]
MEKPILFNTQMVKAILEGRKTSTRRIIKNVEGMEYDRKLNNGNVLFKDAHIFTTKFEIKTPYKVGDILYVRETWANTWTPDGEEGFVYKADGEPAKFPYWGNANQCKDEVWIPSIHMPKQAARIFLKVTDIKVKKIRSTTAGECKKEGIKIDYPITDIYTADEYIEEFKKLWNITVKKESLDKYGWKADPWVWVVEFKRVFKNTI